LCSAPTILLHGSAAGSSAACLGTGLHALFLSLRKLNLARAGWPGCHWCSETKSRRSCKA
jgi:hypothetical protein